MLVYGVTDARLLTRIIADVGLRVYGLKPKGRAMQFDLRRQSEKYAMTDRPGSQRVCCHGYVAFFRALFAAYPTARVVTRMATYAGAGEFVRLHEETFGLVNHTGEACQCNKETGHGETL